MKRFMASLLTVVMCASIFAGCAKPKEDVIKIGVFEPLTGDNAAGGELETDGVKLANTIYPTVLGKKVELVVVDNKSDKAEAATAAARLVEKEKVVAIIGSWGSSLSMAAGDIIKNSKVPTVAPSATNPQVTLNNDFYFRVCFLDPFQGTVMANYATNNLGAKTTAIIQEVSNDYSVGLATFYKDAFVANTGDPASVLEIGNYQTGDKDFSAILTNIKEKNPDVIFAPGNFTESALLIKQARQLGITTQFLGGDTWETDDFLTVGGAEVEGIAFSTFFAREKALTPESEKFLGEFEKLNPGIEPAAVTALGYDAYILILDAITRAGSTDGEAIRAEIAKTVDFQGVTGSISLDENGDAIKDAIIKTVKDNKFTYLDFVPAK